MERSREYVIQFIGLKDGDHEFKYPIGLEFFGSFNDEEVLDANVTMHLTMNKKPEMLEVQFQAEGVVIVACDRCDRPLEIEVEGQQRQVFKVSEREWFDNEEIVAISPSDHEIDVSEHIYECIKLALPLRRVHKKKDCDPIAIEALEAIRSKDEPTGDPRWDALKAL